MPLKSLGSCEWLRKGNEMLDLSNFNDAADAYKKSLTISPTSNAYYNLGTCHFYLGNIDDARDCWQSSLKLDLNRSDAHSNLANIYALKYKDFKKAIEHYESALSLGEDGEIHYNYAVVLDFQGDLEKCIEHYQKARKLGVEIADKNLRNAMAKLIGKNTRRD